jgi:hypothetical protein
MQVGALICVFLIYFKNSAFLEGVKNMAPKAFMPKTLCPTENANNKFVEMKTQAFDFGKGGNKRPRRKHYLTRNTNKEKQIYAKRVNDFIAELQTNIKSIIKTKKELYSFCKILLKWYYSHFSNSY